MDKSLACIAIVFLNFRYTLQNNSTNCSFYKESFATHVGEFTSCAILHSKPVTLCESCVDAYIYVAESYENLTKFSDEESSCIKKLVNLDRLEILLSLFENTNNLWTRAKCFECFVIKDGKLTHNRSETTIKFNELYNNTINCINDTGGHAEQMCNLCMDTYLNLTDFYANMINENDKIAGCMDIVDLMNSTMSAWSDKCCKSRRHNETIFLVTTACVSTISVLFYVFTKMFTDIKKPAIFRQSRLSESLAHIN